MLGKFLKLTPILTLFIFANANAQFEKVGGHWENEDSLRMGIRAESSGNYIITNPTNRFNFLDNNRRFSVRILGDTLRFGNDIVAMRDTIPIDTVYFENFHDFKIITCTDSTLVIVPISPQSIKLLKNRDTLRLSRIDYQLEKSVAFEKLILNHVAPKDYIYENEEDDKTSFYLEIDKKKNIYIDGTFYKDLGGWTTLQGWRYPSYYVIDNSLTGKFTGTLPDSIYDEIMHQLKLNAKYSLMEPILSDSIYSYGFTVIYSNTQQKFTRGFDNFNMDYFLSTINKKLKLTRVIEK